MSKLTEEDRAMIDAALAIPAVRELLGRVLPANADPVLVERQRAIRAYVEARDRGASLEELDPLGDRILQVCAAAPAPRGRQ